MTRLRAAFVAALGCGVLATSSPSGAAGCTWQGFSITARQNTTCTVARKALKHYFGGGGSSQGYTCKATAASGFRAGKCKSGATRSFRFTPR